PAPQPGEPQHAPMSEVTLKFVGPGGPGDLEGNGIDSNDVQAFAAALYNATLPLSQQAARLTAPVDPTTVFAFSPFDNFDIWNGGTHGPGKDFNIDFDDLHYMSTLMANQAPGDLSPDQALEIISAAYQAEVFRHVPEPATDGMMLFGLAALLYQVAR